MSRVTRPGVLAAAALVVLSLAIGVFDWRRDDWAARVDMIQQTIPMSWFLGRQLASGNIPDWNPHIFGGFPFAADPLSGWMVLPMMLWFSIFGPLTAIKLVVITNLLIASLSTYVFARTLGIGVYGSLVAGLAFGCSTFIVKGQTYCCSGYGAWGIWIPVALLGVYLTMLAARPRQWAVGIVVGGIGLGQMLATWVGQGTLYAVLLVASFALIAPLTTEFVPHRKIQWRLGRGLLAGFAVGVFGFALAAASFVPQFAGSGATAIDGGLGYVTKNNGRRWTDLVDRLFNATAAGDVRYVGVVATVFGIFALVLARRRLQAPYFTLLFVAGVLLQSKSSWVHWLLYHLPRFEEVHAHAPQRLSPVLVFALAMMVAISADRLATTSPSRWIAAAPPAIVAFVWFFLRPYQESHRRWYPQLSWVLLGLAVGLLITAIVVPRLLEHRRVPAPVRQRRRGIHRLVLVLIPLLLVADLNGILFVRMIAGRDGYWPFNPTQAHTVAVHTDCKDPGGAGEFLQGQVDPATGGPVHYAGFDPAGMRTAETDGFSGYHGESSSPEYQALLTGLRAICLGIYDAQGYSPIQLNRYVAALVAVNGVALNYHDGYFLSTAPTSPLFPLFGVRYLVLPYDIPAERDDLLYVATTWQQVFANGTVRVFEDEDALPYAWIVHDSVEAPADAVWTTMASANFDPLTTIAIESPVPAPVSDAAPGATDMVTVEAYEPDRVAFRVTSPRAGYLVISEIYAEGWSATVDGRETPVVVANGAWRAIPIGAGDHEIVMTFETPWLRTGLAISLAGWAIVVGVLGWSAVAWWRRRTGQVEQPVD